MDYQLLAHEIREINKTNGWKVFQLGELGNFGKVGTVFALIHSEVSEALEAFRKRDLNNLNEELADIVIRILDFTGGIMDDINERMLIAPAQRDTYDSIQDDYIFPAFLNKLHILLVNANMRFLDMEVSAGCTILLGVITALHNVKFFDMYPEVLRKMGINRNRPFRHGGKVV